MKYRIGVDISGGDFAPQEILKGVCLAKKEFGQDITLIGDKKEIEEDFFKSKDLAAFKDSFRKEFTIVDAPEKIEMAEPAANSVRRKRNSSIVLGAKLLKEKEIDAFVSCGNTGAVVCASTLTLGLLEGIERPGIGLVLPNQRGVSLVIDVGANIDPKPLHLFQYGIMAHVYYNLVFDKEKPTIGLLNIGEEETKGPDFFKYAHKLFSAAPLNFIGNLEAKDIFSGKCDCIICDGFIGNIALKVSESCAEFIGKFLLGMVKKDPLAGLGAFFIRRSLKSFKRKVDYAEYGGAPLLGVNGIVIIGHGRSSARAVKNAVRVAIEELKRELNLRIKEKIDEICQDRRIREVLTT